MAYGYCAVVGIAARGHHRPRILERLRKYWRRYLIRLLAISCLAANLAGCASSIAYRADYVPDKPIADGDRITGRVLIYTTRGDDERLITSGATSVTGSGLKITVPIGTITREIAVKMFSKVASDGANSSNDLTDASRYTIVLRPEAKDLTHGFPQLKNLGFAITPEVHLTMRMSILDATGKPRLEKDYDSGVGVWRKLYDQQKSSGTNKSFGARNNV